MQYAIRSYNRFKYICVFNILKKTNHGNGKIFTKKIDIILFDLITNYVIHGLHDKYTYTYLYLSLYNNK